MHTRLNSKIVLFLLPALLLAGCLPAPASSPQTSSQSTSPLSTSSTTAPSASTPATSSGIPDTPSSTRDLRVAFIYSGTPTDGGWSEAHDKARLQLEKTYPGLQTVFRESVLAGPDAVPVIRELAQQGNDVIVATSEIFEDATRRMAAEFPSVIFLQCDGDTETANLAPYYGRIEEPIYLCGMVAAFVAENGKLGFVAAYPLPEIIREINAFTLGARTIRPGATVEVAWTNGWADPESERQAAFELIDHGCQVIAQHQDTPAAQVAAQSRGQYGIGIHVDMSPFAPKAVLSSAVWDWNVYYAEAIGRIRQGTWHSSTYWGGMKEGIVGLAPFADFLPDQARQAVEDRARDFQSGDWDIFHIFSGPLTSQDGQVRLAGGQSLNLQQLKGMRWFTEGVIGTIPSD